MLQDKITVVKYVADSEENIILIESARVENESDRNKCNKTAM